MYFLKFSCRWNEEKPTRLGKENQICKSVQMIQMQKGIKKLVAVDGATPVEQVFDMGSSAKYQAIQYGQ